MSKQEKKGGQVRLTNIPFLSSKINVGARLAFGRVMIKLRIDPKLKKFFMVYFIDTNILQHCNKSQT